MNLFDDLDLGTAAPAAAPSAAQNMFDSVIPSADFSNVSGGATPPETQEQPKPVSDPTGLKNLFDDVMAFPENFATGAKAIWEGGDYQGDPNDKREVLNPAEGFARRFAGGLASLPGMALEASPIGLTEKLARMAAEKAGVTLPDWVTPTTTLAREANEGINKNIGIDEETMRYVGPRTEFFTNVAADVASNFVPLGPAVKAEVAAKNAYETASAAGAKPWDATAEALSAIKKTAAEPPQAAKAPPSWQDLYTNLERAETPEQAQAASVTLDSTLKGNMFDDIVPEAPKSPPRPANEPVFVGIDRGESGGSMRPTAAESQVRQPVGQEGAPAPVGEASAPLSEVAARIKAANEKSLQETGAPLNAEQIKAIREEVVAPEMAGTADSGIGSWQHNLDTNRVERFYDRADLDKAVETSNTPREVMQEYHAGTLTTGKLLDQLTKDDSGRVEDYHKTLAGYLKAAGERVGGLDVNIGRYNPENPIHAQEKPAAEMPAGYYHPTSNAIRLNKDAPNQHVLVHETIHALTNRAVIRGARGKLGGQAQAAYDALDGVYQGFKKHMESTGELTTIQRKGKDAPSDYGFTNVDEYLAEFFSNAKFREKLKGVKLDDITPASAGGFGRRALGVVRNMYQATVRGIREMLSLPAKAETALDATFASAHQFLGNLKKEHLEPLPLGKQAIPEMREGPYKRSSEVPKEDIPIVPKWQRTLASFISWKGGKRFAEPMERAKLESATSDFHADRAAKLFDKAGLKKMSPEERANVRAALHGDTKASISPEMRKAVDFTRNQIAEYQARLAIMDVKMEGRDLTDMFYESMAKGDYVTRAFNIFESQPTALKKALYAMSGAEELGKPYYRWESEKHRPEAVEAFKKYLMENLVDKSKPIEPQIEDLLNQFSDPKGPGTNIEVVKQAARDSSILKSRVNVPEPVKRYWGEIKDPRLEAALTLSRIGTLTAKQAMLVRMAKEGDGKYFFEDGQQPQGFTEKLPSNSDYGPLSGKYTRPDIADELKTTIGIEKDNPAKAPEKMLRAAWDAYTFLGSSVKILKTVGSATTQAVNWYSNAFLTAKVSVQHALMGKMLGLPEIGKAVATNVRDLFGKLSKEEADVLVSAGILRDGVQFGELKKIRSKVEREVAHEGAKPTMKALYKVKDAGNWLLHTAGDIYQLADNVPRMTFFLGEMAIQKQLHPKWTRQQLIEYSANKARDEVPTYGRASPTVKAISKLEANFATWSGEVVRTTANQIRNGLNDLKNGETAAQKYYGFAQLMGTSAYIAGASAVLPQVIQMFFGFKTDDKKKNEAMSKLAPDFLAGDDLAVAHADPKTGKVVYMDATRLDPSGPFHTLWNREMEAIRKEGLKTPASKVGGAAYDWLIDTFASFGPLPQTAKTVITGKNQYNTELSPDERVAEVGKMLKSGTQMTVEKYNALKKRGVDERVLRATASGLPLYDVDTQQNMRGSGYNLSKAITSYKQQFNRAYGNADATPEEQKEAYIDFLRNEKAEWDKVHDQVKAFQTIFGEKDGKKLAIDSLKSAEINKDYLAAFETGKFKPDNLEESKTFMDSQEAKAIRNDPSHEADIRKDFAKRRYQLTRLRLNYEQYIK